MVRPIDISGLLQSFGQLQQSNANLALRRDRERQRERARRSSHLRTMGTIGGAVVGGVAGGPGGAMAGSQIGGAAGGMISSSEGNEKFNTQEVAQAGMTAYKVQQNQQAQQAAKAKQTQDAQRNLKINSAYSQRNINNMPLLQQSTTNAQFNFLVDVGKSTQDPSATIKYGTALGIGSPSSGGQWKTLTPEEKRTEGIPQNNVIQQNLNTGALKKITVKDAPTTKDAKPKPEPSNVLKTEGQRAKERIVRRRGGMPGLRDEDLEAFQRINAIVAGTGTPARKSAEIRRISPEVQTRIYDVNEVDKRTGENIVIKTSRDFIGDTPVSDPIPLEPKKGVKPSEVSKNIQTLSLVGVIVDKTGDPKAIPVSTGGDNKLGTPVFSLTPAQKSKIANLPWEGKTNAQLRTEILKINKSAFIGSGFESVPGVEKLPDDVIDSLKSKLIDFPKIAEDKLIEKGVKIARQEIEQQIVKGINDTPPNTPQRLTAMKLGVEEASSSGNTEYAKKLTDQISSLDEKLTNKREKQIEKDQKEVDKATKEAEAEKDVDKVYIRRINEQLKKNTVALDKADLLLDRYQENYFTAGGRAKGKVFGGLAYLGGKSLLESVVPDFVEEKPVLWYQKREAYRQLVSETFNEYRRDITGAQASYREIEFLKQALFSNEDDPVAFEARLTQYKELIQRRTRIFNRLRREGFDISEEAMKDENSPAAKAFDQLNAPDLSNPGNREGKDPLIDDYVERANELILFYQKEKGDMLTKKDLGLLIRDDMLREGYSPQQLRF